MGKYKKQYEKDGTYEPQYSGKNVKYGDEEFEFKGGKLKPVHKVKKFK